MVCNYIKWDMCMRLIKRFLILALLLIAVPCWGANYTITSTEDTVDGGANVSGKGRCNAGYVSYAAGPWGVCTSADTIIIDGGARGDLTFQNFDGDPDYITIINEDSTRVVITATSATAGILIDDCKYINLRGNGLSAHNWTRDCKTDSCYGIKVQVSGDPPLALVRVMGDSDNIKLQYIEADMSGKSGGSGAENGFQVQDGALANTDTFDNFEIAYNYIHDTYYHGMYLGHNTPDAGNDPYISSFNVHHNLLEDLGAEGGELKGVEAGSTVQFHHNIVRRTRQQCIYNCGVEEYVEKGWWQYGWIFSDYYENAYAEIYNNWIEETAGSCFHLRSAEHIVYNNVLVGCGTGTCVGELCVSKLDGYFNAIELDKVNLGETLNRRVSEIYNNTIISPLDYGVASLDDEVQANVNDNIIINPGGTDTPAYVNDLAACTPRGTCVEEGTGDDANTNDTSDPGFVDFTDDDDYSNDDFDLASGHSVGVMGNTDLTTDFNDHTREAFTDGAYDGLSIPRLPLQGAAGDLKYK